LQLVVLDDPSVLAGVKVVRPRFAAGAPPWPQLRADANSTYRAATKMTCWRGAVSQARCRSTARQT